MGCPDDLTLDEMFAGQLPTPARIALEQHFEQCPDCQRRISSAVTHDTVIEERFSATLESLSGSRGESPPSALDELKPGDVIAGRFVIDHYIGGGGMGVLLAARHLELEQKVSLKFMHPALLGESEAIERFRREARAAARLRSEHVGRVLDLGKLETGEPFIVMEYLEGQDLAAYLAGRGRLPEAEALEIVLQTCRAVSEAHGAGIVHRDLKPQNLFLTQRADGSRCVKVLDFGISKLMNAEVQLTGSTSLLGSPGYMAPEQFESAGEVDERADVWSLGVILFQLLTGELPFDAESIAGRIGEDPRSTTRRVSDLRAGISPWIDEAVARCLQSSPPERLASVRDLVLRLERPVPPQTIAEERPDAASAPSPPPEPSPTRRRGPARAVVIASAAAASLALFALLLATPSDAPAPEPEAGASPSEPKALDPPVESTGGSSKPIVAPLADAAVAETRPKSGDAAVTSAQKKNLDAATAVADADAPGERAVTKKARDPAAQSDRKRRSRRRKKRRRARDKQEPPEQGRDEPPASDRGDLGEDDILAPDL